MSLVIHCPNCSHRYQVADSACGKLVRCQQCGNTFAAIAAATSPPPPPPVRAPLQPLEQLAGADHLSQWPAAAQPYAGANPLGMPTFFTPGRYEPATRSARNAGVSNPSGGPTNAKMRLIAGGMLAFGLVLTVGSLVIDVLTGTVFMFVLALVPLMLVLGAAGLISPNVVRSMGQYGGHLPGYYKVIGWGLIGFSILVTFPIMIGLFVAGYRTDAPYLGPRVPHVNPSLPPPAQARPESVEATTPPVNHHVDVKENPHAMMQRKGYPVSIEVPEHSVLVPPNAKLPPGTRLQACWDGKWNPITTLTGNQDGSINVRWDDFGADFDCSMVRSELIIRKDVLKQFGGFPSDPASSATPGPGTANASGSVEPKPKPLKSYPVTIGVPADSQVVPADAKLPPGTRLQACWSGKWNPITLLSENKDGNLTVRWDDFGAAFDCSMLRKELIIKQDILKAAQASKLKP